MSYPQATLSANHGLMMQGYAPDPSQNHLFFMGETGVTPETGPDRLPGKYAFGAYLYEEDTAQYGNGKYGFYWQADQMLYRESSGSGPATKAVSPLPNNEGLRMFSLVSFAPPDNNTYPLYAQGGLVYEGVLPKRSKDLAMAAVGAGQYANNSGKTYTMVLEGGYRVQLNVWAFIQPYVQYLVRPNGTSDVRNATVMGFLAGLNF